MKLPGKIAVRRVRPALEAGLPNQEPDSQALAVGAQPCSPEIVATLPQSCLAHRIRLAGRAARRVRVVDASLEPHASIVPHTSVCSSLCYHIPG